MKYISYFLDNSPLGDILFLTKNIAKINGFANPLPKAKSNIKFSEAYMKEIILKVEGMQCGMCESHVNDAVRKAANVKKVTSSHVEGKTVVVCDESIDAQIVKNAIQKDGYNVSEVVEKPYVKKGLFSILKK